MDARTFRIALFLAAALALGVRASWMGDAAAGPIARWWTWDGSEAFDWIRGAPGVYGWIVRAAGGASGVVLLQVLAGAVRTVLIGIAASRVFGRGAGLAAALLASVAGPLVLLDTLVVPESLALLGASAAMVLLLEARARGDLRLLVAAGACLGISSLLSVTAAIAAAGALAGVAIAARDPRVVRAGVFAAAFLLFALPRFAWTAMPELPSIAPSIASALGDVEVPDGDASFEYARAHSLTLSLLPGFRWLLVLALVGIWAASARGTLRLLPRRRGETSPRVPPEIAIALAALVIAFALAAVSGRTRSALVPWMLPFAGFGAAAMFAPLFRRRYARAARVGAAILGLHLALLALPGDRERWRGAFRLGDVVTGAELVASSGSYEKAAAELELGRKWGVARAASARDAAALTAALRREHLRIAIGLGRAESARGDWEELRRFAPDDPVVRRASEILGHGAEPHAP